MNNRKILDRRGFLRTGGAMAASAALLPQLLTACGGDDSSDASTTTGGRSTTPGSSATTSSSLVTPNASAAAELFRTEMVLGWLANVQFAGTWLAEANGYFADANVELGIRPGGPNTPSAPELVSGGSVEIGQVTNFRQLVEAIAQGNDFVAFAAKYQQDPAGLLSLAGNPVLKPEDLLGKRILGPNPVDAKSIEVILELNGLPKDEFEFVPAGFGPEPLLAGDGDVMVVFVINQPITLEDQGLVADTDFFARTYTTFGLPSYSNVYFAQRQYVEEHRDGIVRFLRSERRGWQENEIDPTVAADLATNRFGVDNGLDLDQQVRQNELQIPLLRSADTDEHGLLWLSKERVANEMYPAIEAAGLTALPDVDQWIDETLLADAGA